MNLSLFILLAQLTGGFVSRAAEPSLPLCGGLVAAQEESDTIVRKRHVQADSYRTSVELSFCSRCEVHVLAGAGFYGREVNLMLLRLMGRTRLEGSLEPLAIVMTRHSTALRCPPNRGAMPEPNRSGGR